MNEEPTIIQNTFDPRLWRFKLVMLFSFFLLMALLIIVGNKLIISIIIGFICFLAFYMIIIHEIRLTPIIVEFASGGIKLRFKMGRSIFLGWTDIIGWIQMKPAGENSCVGIWTKNNRMYRFDNKSFVVLKIKYSESKGRALEELPKEYFIPSMKNPVSNKKIVIGCCDSDQ
jgi:hypothetical protein